MSTADSAQPRNCSNVTRPFPASGRGLGSRDEEAIDILSHNYLLLTSYVGLAFKVWMCSST